MWYFYGMRLSREKLGALCRKQGLTVEGLLRTAGVSRNAYYTLARKNSILPKTVIALAKALEISPGRLLTDSSSPATEAHRLMREVAAIVRRHRGIDPDNVRHTLLLLRRKPVDRLRGALRRGRSVDIQRKGSRLLA